jgi:diguanylate cyclase (GGDEF)-like protein
VSKTLTIVRSNGARCATEAERPLEKAFDIAPAGMCVLDPEGRVIRTNPAFRDRLDSPDALAPTRGLLRQLLRAGRSCGSIEQRLRRPGAPSLWLRVTVSVVRGAGGAAERAVAVVEDVTGRKQPDEAREDAGNRIEERLRETEGHFRAVVEQSIDGIVMVDGNGIVRMANPAADRLLASPGATLTGLPFDGPEANGEPRELRVAPDGRPPRIVEIRGTRTELGGEAALVYNVRDITDMARLRDELRALSLLDELTRLYNRRGFLTLGQQQIALADRTRRPMLVVFADLDGMKHINDSQGHAEGDRALQDMASVFRSSFRRSDVVARIGGDEFAAITVEAAEQGGSVIETRLAQNMADLNASGNRPYVLAASVGLVPYDPAHPCGIEEVLEAADRRMYERKRAKRTSGATLRPD